MAIKTLSVCLFLLFIGSGVARASLCKTSFEALVSSVYSILDKWNVDYHTKSRHGYWAKEIGAELQRSGYQPLLRRLKEELKIVDKNVKSAQSDMDRAYRNWNTFRDRGELKGSYVALARVGVFHKESDRKFAYPTQHSTSELHSKIKSAEELERKAQVWYEEYDSVRDRLARLKIRQAQLEYQIEYLKNNKS